MYEEDEKKKKKDVIFVLLLRKYVFLNDIFITSRFLYIHIARSLSIKIINQTICFCLHT
jgi:hypothetical protein